MYSFNDSNVCSNLMAWMTYFCASIQHSSLVVQLCNSFTLCFQCHLGLAIIVGSSLLVLGRLSDQLSCKAWRGHRLTQALYEQWLCLSMPFKQH